MGFFFFYYGIYNWIKLIIGHIWYFAICILTFDKPSLPDTLSCEFEHPVCTKNLLGIK